MKSKIKLPLLIFAILGFSIMAQSQSGDIDYALDEIPKLKTRDKVIKDEIADLKKELELLKSKPAGPSKINDSLLVEIERLKRLDEDRQTQLGTLLSISEITSSSVGNKLDGIAIVLTVFGLLFSIAVIGLGIYINNKEKKISNLLDRSDENLKKQAESEQRADQTRELIYKDLTSLYNKLREEELKDILKRVEADPHQIETHTSRLLTLDMQDEHFVQIRDLFFKWKKDEYHSYFTMFLTILLISHFPLDVATNQGLLPSMKYHFGRVFRSITLNKLNTFLQKLLDFYFNGNHPGLGDCISEAIKALSDTFNPNYVAEEMLFEANESKEKRFEIYNLIKPIAISSPLLFIKYKNLMINTYSDTTQNTEQENKLIEEMKANNAH